MEYRVGDKFKIIDPWCNKELRRLTWTITEIDLTSDYPIEATDQKNKYEHSLSLAYMVNNCKRNNE